MSNSQKIIICPNAERDTGFEMARRVGEMLKKHGRLTAFCPVFDDCSTARIPPPGYIPAELGDEVSSAEMIITIGGDGTILRAARVAAENGVPILGINLGGKGFLAELEAGDISMIGAAALGEYRLESRMMLDVEVLREGERFFIDFALNDVIIKGDNKVIDLKLYGDGQLISHFSGDGVVIATPTGSTAYSMAAGGPIVEEAAHNIIVTPICAHILEAKSIVLVSDRRVSVELGDKKRNPAYMSVDGGEHTSIQNGDLINVQKSDKYTRLVRLSSRSFYKKVSDKLGERVE